MLNFSNGGFAPEFAHEISEIAVPEHIETLYLDFETSSGAHDVDSLNPFHNCKPIGAGVTWDDCHKAYYIGAHVDNGWQFLQKILQRSKTWANHNVKYDAHVYQNNVADLPRELDLRCTVVGSKLLDTNLAYRGGYSLDNVATNWLCEDITRYEKSLAAYLHRNKDYGAIPFDIIAEYGCQDVLTTRRLDRYIAAKMPESCSAVWQTENALTKILFEMEQRGLHVDCDELQKTELAVLHRLLQLQEILHNLTGSAFRPHTNADCQEILCNRYGLPVISWTEQGEASFDKYALANYLAMPDAPQEIVRHIMEYRNWHTLRNFFITPYQELQVDGVLHSSYNQLVRTGRMSCKWPNSQQLNKAAKKLIHPKPGYSFISIDFSAIEFRYIVHYIKDETCIEAYRKNPDIDFHQWVADMCGIKRRPAKTVNFMVAFGGGKGKTISTLAANQDVIEDIKREIGEDAPIHVFRMKCAERGTNIYNQYHDTLPTLKRTARGAAMVAASRGYVFNVYGRRRHFGDSRHAHIAFNTLAQSSAADLLKERTVAMASLVRGTPIEIVASVHDETLLQAPTDIATDPRTINDLVACMETPNVPISVPIRCSLGISATHWAESGADNVSKPRKWEFQGNLRHIK